MTKTLLAASLAVLLSTAAHANVISAEYNLAPNTTQLHHVHFDVTTAGTFTMDVFGLSTLGAGYNSDTYLHLFQTSLTLANHLGLDDDSGIEVDAQLVMNLGVGHYILAAADCCNPSVQDAIDGIGGPVEEPGGLIRVQISSRDDGVAAFPNQTVPEPASYGLVALALLGAAAARRRAR